MSALSGLRPFAIIAALLAASLLVIAGLVSADAASLIIPPPEGVAEQVVTALGAHRYEGAMNQLSDDLQQQVGEEDLQAFVEAVEESPREGIQDAHGQDAQESGNQATASVEVKFGNNETQTIDLPLAKENGLWKVTSLEPLRTLANGQ